MVLIKSYLHVNTDVKILCLNWKNLGIINHFTLYNVRAVPWGYHEYRGGISCGVFSTMGDIMINVGDILSTVGCSVPWGISWVLWGYLEYCGVFSTMGDIMMHMGISWVPWRVFSTMGGKSFVIWVPYGTEHPHGTHDIPTCIMISPWYSNFKGWYPPWYWTAPTALMISPMCIMISPTVLNTTHGTQDNPPQYSWYPHGTEHPHGTQISPTFIMISPRYWTPPWYSRYPPRYSWYPQQYWTSHCTEHPQGTAHTLYRVHMEILAAKSNSMDLKSLQTKFQLLPHKDQRKHLFQWHYLVSKSGYLWCWIFLLLWQQQPSNFNFLIGLEEIFQKMYTLTTFYLLFLR